MKPDRSSTTRARKVLTILRKQYPQPKTALKFGTPHQLVVSTILSAQCTDVRVNLVTPALFGKYPSVKAFASAKQEELEQDIRSTGFYRNKARSIIGNAQALLERHDGVVPRTMAELTDLPGIGRKTANCVLGAVYGINEGVVVDTHVIRLSQRLGLSKHSTPEKIERDLMSLIPKKEWYNFSNILILHGRNLCNARKPDCPRCPVRLQCPSAKKMLRAFWEE
jgi:endonuclease-3